MFDATGVTLAVKGADVAVRVGAEWEGCALVVVLVVAGHSGRGVLEHAARASAEPIMSQRDACVAMV